jgi:hypothetical protein
MVSALLTSSAASASAIPCRSRRFLMPSSRSRKESAPPMRPPNGPDSSLPNRASRSASRRPPYEACRADA